MEKAAYDYAHSLKLPDSVPQEAPYFPFWWARMVALIPGAPSVDEAYFRHLCEHEAGDYVFKRVDDVEGVFQLRPREMIYGSPIDDDRYRLDHIQDDQPVPSFASTFFQAHVSMETRRPFRLIPRWTRLPLVSRYLMKLSLLTVAIIRSAEVISTGPAYRSRSARARIGHLWFHEKYIPDDREL